MSAILENQDLSGGGPDGGAMVALAGRTLAQFTIVALLVGAILDAVGVISRFAEVNLVTRVMNGDVVTYQEAAASDNRQMVIGYLQFGIFLVTATLFLCWLYRAHKNLRLLNVTGLKYAPKWAVWGFVIPILAWFRPYQVTKEIWQGSDPVYRNTEGQSWQQAPVGALMPLWWALWLVSNIAGAVAFRSSFLGSDLDMLRTRSILYLVADACAMLAAVPAMYVVRSIAARQEEKLHSLGKAHEAVSPLPATFRLQEPRPAAVEQRVCGDPDCGRRLQPEWSYCAYCLARVEARSPEFVAPAARIDSDPARALVCANPRCGRELRAEWGFCPYCDTPRMRAGRRPSGDGTGTRIHTALQD